MRALRRLALFALSLALFFTVMEDGTATRVRMRTMFTTIISSMSVKPRSAPPRRQIRRATI